MEMKLVTQNSIVVASLLLLLEEKKGTCDLVDTIDYIL